MATSLEPSQPNFTPITYARRATNPEAKIGQAYKPTKPVGLLTNGTDV